MQVIEYMICVIADNAQGTFAMARNETNWAKWVRATGRMARAERTAELNRALRAGEPWAVTQWNAATR